MSGCYDKSKNTRDKSKLEEKIITAVAIRHVDMSKSSGENLTTRR